MISSIGKLALPFTSVESVAVYLLLVIFLNVQECQSYSQFDNCI